MPMVSLNETYCDNYLPSQSIGIPADHLAGPLFLLLCHRNAHTAGPDPRLCASYLFQLPFQCSGIVLAEGTPSFEEGTMWHVLQMKLSACNNLSSLQYECYYMCNTLDVSSKYLNRQHQVYWYIRHYKFFLKYYWTEDCSRVSFEYLFQVFREIFDQTPHQSNSMLSYNRIRRKGIHSGNNAYMDNTEVTYLSDKGAR